MKPKPPVPSGFPAKIDHALRQSRVVVVSVSMPCGARSARSSGVRLSPARAGSATVLRLAPLGDVELRENLQASRDAGGHLLRHPLHLPEHAVDTEPHDERVLLRLEVAAGRLRPARHSMRVGCPWAAPSKGYRRRRAPLDVRLGSEEREVRVEDRVAEEESDDGAEREEWHERHTHLAC